MQQNNYVNPAEVLSGRKFLSKTGRKLAVRRAIPYFWAARDTLGIVFLIPLFLWMRLPNLMALPIFYDETIYLSYAREYMTDPQRNALISAERDGKPPLFIWGLSWFWNLFPDPLTGARLMSVVGGAVSCILVYLIGKRLLSPVAGFLSSLFYILCPLFVLHNRLAVHSSWETVAGMGTLYFAIAIAQQPRAVFALGMGASLGLGMLVKQSALFYFGLAPLVAFFISRRPDIWARLKEHQPGILRRFSVWWYKLRIPRLPKFGFGAATQTRRMLNERESTTLWVVTKAHKRQVHTQRALKIRAFTFMAIVGFVGIAVAGAIYLPLQTHPEASYLSSTDTSYALTLPELLRFPTDIWRSNFNQTWEWWLTYYSIPVMVMAVAALGYAVVKPKYAQAEVILLAWTILPIFAQMLLARQHWFSRYITPFGPPMLIVAALVIVRLSKYVIRISRERMNWTGAAGAMFGVCLTLIVIIPWLRLDDQLINRPVEAELASRDRWQYIEGWPSGYAMEDSIAYIRQLAATDPVLIYMDQDNVTQETYYLDRLNTLKGWVFYGRTNGVNWLTRNFRGERNTYYLTSVQPDEILLPYLKLSKTFPKPGGKSSISIYHFVPPDVGPEPVIKAEGQ